jgi:hypothetical protein
MRPFAQQTVLGHVVTEPNQCFRLNLRVDDVVGEYGFGMNVGGILPLLYVNGPTL